MLSSGKLCQSKYRFDFIVFVIGSVERHLLIYIDDYSLLFKIYNAHPIKIFVRKENSELNIKTKPKIITYRHENTP